MSTAVSSVALVPGRRAVTYQFSEEQIFDELALHWRRSGTTVPQTMAVVHTDVFNAYLLDRVPLSAATAFRVSDYTLIVFNRLDLLLFQLWFPSVQMFSEATFEAIVVHQRQQSDTATATTPLPVLVNPPETFLENNGQAAHMRVLLTFVDDVVRRTLYAAQIPLVSLLWTTTTNVDLTTETTTTTTPVSSTGTVPVPTDSTLVPRSLPKRRLLVRPTLRPADNVTASQTISLATIEADVADYRRNSPTAATRRRARRNGPATVYAATTLPPLLTLRWLGHLLKATDVTIDASLRDHLTPTVIARSGSAELITLLGVVVIVEAVQVPPDGQPTVLPSKSTLGGCYTCRARRV